MSRLIRQTRTPPCSPQPIGSLSIKLRPGGDPGDYHQAVSLVLRCRGTDRAKLDLPVEWSIRPSVEAQPDRLWLGTHLSGTRISKRMILRSNDGTPLPVVQVTSEPSKYLIGSKATPEADGSIALDLDLAISGDPGIRRGHLSIIIGDDRSKTILIPISAIIQADEKKSVSH
jgi:hypothetical protein